MRGGDAILAGDSTHVSESPRTGFRSRRKSGASGLPSLGSTGSPSGTSFERQYAIATAVFAVLVIGIIFVFGQLISQSLSRRYLEDVLISGREEAQKVAEEIGASGTADVRHVFEKRREELVRTLEGVAQRKVLESIEVTDPNGEVVFTSFFRSTEQVSEEIADHLEISGTLSDQDVTETESSYRITVPLGEIGEVVLNVSKGRIAERVVRLRRELLKQTIKVAVLTLLTLVVAFGFVWRLIQRTRRLEAQRREAQELAALGSLAANLAHEIRNPLNSINLNLELLEEDLEGEADEAVSSLVSTRQEVGRLARLVSDFLTYARPTEPQTARIRADILVEEVVEFLRGEARRMGVHLRALGAHDDVCLMADSGQLRQVLLNLVLNAVQATAKLEPDRRVVELRVESTDSHAAIIVRDRGDGIPPDELVRVRRAFYTRRRGGTGLGLAIAERIVTAHRGRLELVNLEPKGFEARVVLPRGDDDGKLCQ